MLWLSGALLVLQLVSALPRVHYSGNAIARSQQEQTISPDAVTVTLASLLSVKAPLSVNSDVSRQVSKDMFGLNIASGAFHGFIRSQVPGAAGRAVAGARSFQPAHSCYVCCNCRVKHRQVAQSLNPYNLHSPDADI